MEKDKKDLSKAAMELKADNAVSLPAIMHLSEPCNKYRDHFKAYNAFCLSIEAYNTSRYPSHPFYKNISRLL